MIHVAGRGVPDCVCLYLFILAAAGTLLSHTFLIDCMLLSIHVAGPSDEESGLCLKKWPISREGDDLIG